MMALGTLIFIVSFAIGDAVALLGGPDVSIGIWIGFGLVVLGLIILTGDEEPHSSD